MNSLVIDTEKRKQTAFGEIELTCVKIQIQGKLSDDFARRFYFWIDGKKNSTEYLFIEFTCLSLSLLAWFPSSQKSREVLIRQELNWDS